MLLLISPCHVIYSMATNIQFTSYNLQSPPPAHHSYNAMFGRKDSADSLLMDMIFEDSGTTGTEKGGVCLEAVQSLTSGILNILIPHTSSAQTTNTSHAC